VIELSWKEQGQYPTEAGLERTGIAGNPMLPRLFFAMVKGQETLGPTLCGERIDLIDGAEGLDSSVLLPKLLAKTQCDLGFSGRHSLVGEREGIPDLGGPCELVDELAGAFGGGDVLLPCIEVILGQEGLRCAVRLARIGFHLEWLPHGWADERRGFSAFHGAQCGGDERHELSIHLLEVVDRLPVLSLREHGPWVSTLRGDP
jgi:hypothetical protein